MSSKTNSRNSTKVLGALLAVILLGAGILTVLEFNDTTHLFHSAKSSSQTDAINYAPATPQEHADSESHKGAPDSSTVTGTSGSTSDSTQSKKTVSVEITTYRQYSTTFDVNSQVNGVVETGGTCKLSMTPKDGSSATVTQSRSSEANATNTTCGVISVPLSKLHAGTWNVTVSYSSTTAKGVSDVNQLEVH